MYIYVCILEICIYFYISHHFFQLKFTPLHAMCSLVHHWLSECGQSLNYYAVILERE